MTTEEVSRREFLATASAAGAGAWFSRSFLVAPHRDLTSLTIEEASSQLRSRAIVSTDLTIAYLDRIERLNPSLNAFITVARDAALDRAAKLDQELRRGRWRGPLHGIPVALKDNIDTKGMRTTAGSGVFADRVPDADAAVVTKLTDAGAVILGKLNMHECAFGPTGAVSYFGPMHNPWNLAHITGGSSGGAGAAVAASMCAAALGTDTGGSIRIPAAYCGVVGMKPTYGLVSNRGVMPLAWTLDHVGPMCRSVRDAALLLECIAGYDPQDPTSSRLPIPGNSALARERPSALRVGVARAFFYDRLDPDVQAAAENALKDLRPLVASMREITLPSVPDLSIIAFVEAYAFHAESLKDERRRNLYQPVTRELLLMGREVPVAEYAAARRLVDSLRHQILDTFSSVDVVVTPTTANLPMTIEEALRPPSQPGPPLEIRNTTPFNAFGLPTISIPCGYSGAGFPIGLQISGAPGADTKVLALALTYEAHTQWHTRHPRLTSRDA